MTFPMQQMKPVILMLIVQSLESFHFLELINWLQGFFPLFSLVFVVVVVIVCLSLVNVIVCLSLVCLSKA